MRLKLVGSIFSFIVRYSATAYATCSIVNETGHSFTIASGNISNQRVGAHTTTTIEPGAVSAKGDDGKTNFGGFCQDGQSVQVIEKDGVVMMVPK